MHCDGGQRPDDLFGPPVIGHDQVARRCLHSANRRRASTSPTPARARPRAPRPVLQSWKASSGRALPQRAASAPTPLARDAERVEVKIRSREQLPAAPLIPGLPLEPGAYSWRAELAGQHEENWRARFYMQPPQQHSTITFSRPSQPHRSVGGRRVGLFLRESCYYPGQSLLGFVK